LNMPRVFWSSISHYPPLQPTEREYTPANSVVNGEFDADCGFILSKDYAREEGLNSGLTSLFLHRLTYSWTLTAAAYMHSKIPTLAVSLTSQGMRRRM
jgi:hypothetical protein